jgi:hypothetical protein
MQPLSSPIEPMSLFSEIRSGLKVRLSTPFFIRLRSWEYWPFAVVYAPVFVYWLWLSAKARSFFFFTASNPGIETGGMLGESKIDILNQISDEFKPKTIFVRANTTAQDVLATLATLNVSFPIIAKPNAGERGWLVEKLTTKAELMEYATTSPVDFLIQEYVDEPLELGVFYYRMPGPRSVGETKGVISSIVQKEFLRIRGNGHDSIETLIGQNDRAILQLSVLRERYGNRFAEVLPIGETLLLMPIGNHSRGTKFLNANHLITDELVQLFDRISQPVAGFYYGRYDLRCRSVADLYAGKHIKIVELNGVGAEPAHIYQPGFSIWEGWRVLLQHWQVIYKISRENHRQGVAYMTFAEIRAVWKRIQR